MSTAPDYSPYDQAIYSAVADSNASYGVSIPPGLFRQLIFSESSFNPNAPAGLGTYAGLGQIGPDAIRDVRGNISDAQVKAIQSDPYANIRASADYLAKLVGRYGNIPNALSHYKGSGGPESQALANQVLKDSGYGDLIPSDWQSVISESVGNKNKTVYQNADGSYSEQKPQGSAAKWGKLQKYGASGALLVLGVGLLLIIVGKDTWSTLKSKAITL